MSNWSKLNDKQALKVKAIIDMMGDKQHFKLNADEELYMPLVVEYLYTVPDFAGWKNLKVYSFAHYKEMHGDLARDPEMCFLYKDDESVIYPLVVPYYFLNDTGIHTETEAIDLEKKTINATKQRELTTFFNQWLDNICYQQKIKPAAPSESLKEIRQEKKEGKKLVERAVKLGDFYKKYPELKEVWNALPKSGEKENLLLEKLDESIDAFAEEIKKQAAEAEVPAEPIIDNSTEQKEEPMNKFKENDTVTDSAHPEYGTGTILSVREGDEVRIQWSAQMQPIQVLIKRLHPNTWERISVVVPEENLDKPTPAAKEEVVETEAAVEVTNPVNWFDGDKYFQDNPENILGIPYEASGRFGKVTKYKGTITDIEKIEANTEFLKPENFDNNALITVINPTASELITKPNAQENARKAIEKSKQTIARKVSAKHNINISATENAVLQSIYEIDEKYNAHIPNDDFFAFIWYRDSIGERLGQFWYDIAFSRGTTIDEMYSEETLKHWVNNGNLFYYGGTQVKKGSTKLIPAYLYLAENIWHKEAQLKIDKEAIIEAYGEEVFRKQEEALTIAFRAKYEKRLLIKGAGDNGGLVLLPISKMAKTFMISTLSDEEPFIFKKVTSQGKHYGKPHFFHPEFLTKSRWGRNKGETFEQLSLTDAFCAWLIKDTTIQFKKGTTYIDIIDVYINKRNKPKYTATEDDKLGRDREDAEWQRKKSKSKEEGDRLFLDFLNTQLTLNDRIRLEAQWNSSFNSYVPIDFNRIPIVFECVREFRGEPVVEIKPEKREAAAFVFSEGSGCLAYGTGIGKTYSSIFTVAQFMYSGYAKKPLFVVPNSVYKQFMAEITGLLPQFKILALYNMSSKYLEQLKDADGNIKPLEENTISIMTYEGFERIGFTDETSDNIMAELYDILNQGGIDEYSNEKAKVKYQQRLEALIGRGMRGTLINIEDLGFDYITFDEAHRMKKTFTVVKGDADKSDSEQSEEKSSGKKKSTRPYKIQNGTPSDVALKGFMISYYIQKNNHWRNICLLTATPFTNSPLEIFSMLTFLAYKKLKSENMNSLVNFFDTFIDVKNELVINAKLQPQRKEVIIGFNNLVALQQLIRRFINYKGEKDVDVKKPNKIVLPLLKKRVGDQIIKLSEEEKVDTILPLTFIQQNLMEQVKNYVEGRLEENDLGVLADYEYEEEQIDTESDDANEDNSTETETVNYEVLEKDEKLGVRILKGVSFARDIAISPYLYKYSKLGTPTYIKYVEDSAKLKYIMGCIKSVKQWHEDNGTPVSGQIIYMDRGKQFFKYIREYLMKELGYTGDEIAIASSGMAEQGAFSKFGIQNRFLGKRYNEETMDMEDIPDNERVKVLIGTSTIREGMNLQTHGSVLYNATVDWNPTDQIQLDGRIHRQGNQFKNVRIVIPLMIDSMDIFIFQKLEEKTARINMIWATDGKENVLKIDDQINPNEAKHAMIKDEKVLAELLIKERVEDMQDRIGGLEAEMKRIDNMLGYVKDIDDRIEDAVEFLSKYRDLKEFEPNTPIWEKGKYLAGKMVEFLKKPTNKKGELIFTDSEWRYSHASEIAPHIKRGEKVSEERADYGAKTKPYWFDEFNLAQRQMNKENESYLIPKKIKADRLDRYKDKLQAEANELRESVDKMESEENVKIVANEIREERKAAKFRIRDVHEVVNDFKKLNFLLAEKEIAKKTIPLNPPRLAADSKVKKQMKDLITILKKA